MYYHPRRSAHEDRVYKQRQYENALQEKLRFVRRYEKLMRYAQFEEVNEPKVSYRNLSEKLEAIRAHRETVLEDRRKRLRYLLEREEEDLKQEIRTCAMNLAERRACLKAQALSQSALKKHQNLSSSQGHGETELEKTIQRSYDDMAMHNSRVALRKACEAEKERERAEREERRNRRRSQGKDVRFGSLQYEEEEEAAAAAAEEKAGMSGRKAGTECSEMSGPRYEAGHTSDHTFDHSESSGRDIIRSHLHMVQRLREDEMMAVEEDLINMNSRWLDEEEALRRSHVEQRHQQSLEVQKDLLGFGFDTGSRVDGDGTGGGPHISAMVAEREAQHSRELEELKESHRREAIAYVKQLGKAVENQRCEDEELEELIKAKMKEPCHSEPRQFRGISEGAREDERKTMDDSKLSKDDLVNAIEGQIRGLNALELVDQETKRLALQDQGNKGKHQGSDTRKKQTLADVVYPEPYFGRKAVKWYD